MTENDMEHLHACESMVPLIVRYVDGALAPEDRARLDAHTASCAACRDAIRDQSLAANLLSELPMPEVGRDFAARVRERVVPAGGLLDLLNWRAWSFRLVPIAALLALLAWMPVTSERSGGGTETASAQIDVWAAGGANSTTALLVSGQTDAGELIAATYAGDSR